MGLKDDLSGMIAGTFSSGWKQRAGRVVPDADSLRFANEAVEFEDATVLYADMAGSTNLVDDYYWWFAAEIYKCFLYCAARIIGSEGGTVTAYDGDRVMAVFIGEGKEAAAGRTALKINYCVTYILNPLIPSYYATAYRFRHVVGVDSSSIRAARTGARGANDLVWVGRAANYAAKLAELSADYPSRVTAAVYDKLPGDVRVSADGRPMWERVAWTDMNRMPIYRSTWLWRIG